MATAVGFAHASGPFEGAPDPASLGPIEPVHVEDVDAFRARMEAKGARARALREERERAARSQAVAAARLARDPAAAAPPAERAERPAPVVDVEPSSPALVVEPSAAPAAGSGVSVGVERDRWIVEAYEAGSVVPAIAQALGASTATVYRALRRAGVVMRDDRATNSGGRPKAPEADPPDLVAAVVAAYGGGASLQEVAAQVPGVGSVKHASNLLTRHGVTLRPARSEPVVTPEQLEQMRQLRAEGLSQQEIGERVGISQNTVSKWLRGLRTHKPPEPPKPAKAARPPRVVPQRAPAPVVDVQALTAEAVAAYAAGETIGAIATRLHRAASTVRGWLVDAGVQIRPPGRRPTTPARIAAAAAPAEPARRDPAPSRPAPLSTPPEPDPVPAPDAEPLAPAAAAPPAPAPAPLPWPALADATALADLNGELVRIVGAVVDAVDELDQVGGLIASARMRLRTARTAATHLLASLPVPTPTTGVHDA